MATSEHAIRKLGLKFSSVVWNLFGLGAPLVFALALIPVILRQMGSERFGLLTLAWAALGYASIFDLGIGRATTQYIAELRGAGRASAAVSVVRVAVKTTVIISAAGALLLFGLAIGGLHEQITASADVLAELEISIFLLCLALPLQAISVTYRGVNEAFENFRAVSFVRAILGIASFVGPAVISYYWRELHWAVLALVVSRAMGLVLYRYVALRAIELSDDQRSSFNYPTQRAINARLLSFGGWASVSAVLSPLMVQVDKFVIAAMISAAAVTGYSLPFSIVSQSLVLVGAFTTAFYPALTRLLIERPCEARVAFNHWMLRVGSVMLIITATLAIAMPHILPLWLDQSVPIDSVRAGQVLCIGVLFNSIGALYYSRLHASGRSDVTAKIHLVEAPIYFAALLMLIAKFGIVGAAAAWSFRMALDTAFLAWSSRRLYA